MVGDWGEVEQGSRGEPVAGHFLSKELTAITSCVAYLGQSCTILLCGFERPSLLFFLFFSFNRGNDDRLALVSWLKHTTDNREVAGSSQPGPPDLSGV